MEIWRNGIATVLKTVHPRKVCGFDPYYLRLKGRCMWLIIVLYITIFLFLQPYIIIRPKTDRETPNVDAVIRISRVVRNRCKLHMGVDREP